MTWKSVEELSVHTKKLWHWAIALSFLLHGVAYASLGSVKVTRLSPPRKSQVDFEVVKAPERQSTPETPEPPEPPPATKPQQERAPAPPVTEPPAPPVADPPEAPVVDREALPTSEGVTLAGRFASEASYNRALCLVRLGRHAEAKRALEPFASGTMGYRQSEARQLLQELEAK